MKNDPFVEFFEAVSEAGAAAAEKGALRFIRATVLTVNPITLDVCGTPQEASRVHVCSHLMDGYSETMNVSGSLSISASCPMGSHSSMSVNSGTLKLTQAKKPLKPGDQVIVLTDDDQTFILFDKVVQQ